jgi:tetratricopeptide (TPR) repeat protein
VALGSWHRMQRIAPLGLWLVVSTAFGGGWAAEPAVSPVEELIRAGKLGEALPAAAAEAAARPSDAAAWERWIDLAVELGQVGPVRQALDARRKASPEDPLVAYLLGRLAPSPEDSRAAYEAALKLDPAHARAWMGLGALYRAAGALRDAAGAYQRALRGDPGLAEAWAGLLACVLAGDDREAAVSVARAATSAVPSSPEGWLAWARLVPAEAGQVLGKAAAVAGHDARVHASHAEWLVSQGDGRGALAAADRALAIDPDQRTARLARLYARELAAGRLDLDAVRRLVEVAAFEAAEPVRARQAYDALIGAWPASPLPRMARARVTAPTVPSAAAEDLLAALALDPGNEEASAALGLLRVQQGRQADAIPLLTPLVAARPQDARLAIALARALFGVERAEEAHAVLAAAEVALPMDVEVALVRAHLLSLAGDAAGALEVLEAAVDRLPDLRLGLARAAAAKEAGELALAARYYRVLAVATGDGRLSAIADGLDGGGRAASP